MNALNRRELLRAVTAAAAACGISWHARASGAAPPPIKIGQIGVAHAHASKLGVYRKSPDYEVVGIVEPNEERRRRAESQEPYAGLPWMTAEQLLNQPGLQAVLVETEVRRLLDTAETCVAAGMHVHVDKPAGESLPQFQRLLDAARQKKLLVQLGYMYRYNPGVALLRRVLEEGWLGEIFEIHAVMSKVVDASSRRGLADYRGGIMFELGCHVIDLVVGLAGPPENITPFHRRSGPHDDALTDNMLAVFEYPRALATVKSTALEVEGFARRHLCVCGTGGTLQIQPLDSPSVRVAFSQPREGHQPGYHDVKLPEFVRYVADAADMATVIRGGPDSDFASFTRKRDPQFPYGHELAVQAAVLAASGLAPQG